MRIISDFRDYYDVGMQNGVDMKLPYQRFTREESAYIEMKGVAWRRVSLNRYSEDLYAPYITTLYIGFAGVVYPAILQQKTDDEYLVFYDLTELADDFYEEQLKMRGYNPYFGVQRRLREKDRKESLKKIKEELNNIWEYRSNKGLLSLFEQFQTAIFVHRMGSGRVVINERLNQYGFQKVLPPMQAFQELEMYVGSYLTQPVIEEPPISDKIKAEIHGFDKYSFRKDKE